MVFYCPIYSFSFFSMNQEVDSQIKVYQIFLKVKLSFEIGNSYLILIESTQNWLTLDHQLSPTKIAFSSNFEQANHYSHVQCNICIYFRFYVSQDLPPQLKDQILYVQN